MAASVQSQRSGSRLAVSMLAMGTVLAVTVGFRQVAVPLYHSPYAGLGGGIEPFSRAMALASLLWGRQASLREALPSKPAPRASCVAPSSNSEELPLRDAKQRGHLCLYRISARTFLR